MSTLTDLKAAFLLAVTGKRNRTDAEMAYYEMAAGGAIPFVDPATLSADDTLYWDADNSTWVAGPAGAGGIITVDDISDATATGKALMLAESAEAALTLLNGIPLTQKGAVNGVASLGADGKVPSAQLPSGGGGGGGDTIEHTVASGDWAGAVSRVVATQDDDNFGEPVVHVEIYASDGAGNAKLTDFRIGSGGVDLRNSTGEQVGGGFFYQDDWYSRSGSLTETSLREFPGFNPTAPKLQLVWVYNGESGNFEWEVPA